jgi:hypothetical protein
VVPKESGREEKSTSNEENQRLLLLSHAIIVLFFHLCFLKHYCDTGKTEKPKK